MSTATNLLLIFSDYPYIPPLPPRSRFRITNSLVIRKTNTGESRITYSPPSKAKK